MELQSKFNPLLSTMPTRIVKTGLSANSRLSNFNIEATTTISDPDPVEDQNYVNQNKSFHLFNFELFPTRKWCQKWDGKLFRLSIINAIVLFYNNYKLFNIQFMPFCQLFIHYYYLSFIKSKPHPKQNYKFHNQPKQHVLLKIRHNTSTFNVTVKTTIAISHVKSIISKIIGYSSEDFYLSTRVKYLNDSKAVEIYDLDNKEISVIFRIKGGSDFPNLDDNVHATSHPISIHRPFFLDSDNSPNTWLLLLEFSFTSSRFSASTKAQHLTALLPTEILQALGPKIIAIMNHDKLNCNYFTEICNLVREFYVPSQTDLFEKYFRTQSLGSLSPSQFLSKACADLERLHPGSSSNMDILRRFFLAVLPPTARAILAGSEKSSLTELAGIADKVLVNLPETTVSNIEPSVINIIKDLANQVASLQLEFSSQRSSRPLSRSQPSLQRERSKSISRILCTHHFKYKSSATKCCIGCTWSDKKNCSINQICVYHDVYASSAKRCLDGCTFQKN